DRIVATEDGRMERRCERGTLATGGNVGTAEIRDRGDAGAFGDYRRIAELQGEGQRSVGTVANGLAVRADRANLGWCDVRLPEQVERRIGETRAERRVESTQRVERNRGVGSSQREHLVAQAAGVRRGRGGEDFE